MNWDEFNLGSLELFIIQHLEKSPLFVKLNVFRRCKPILNNSWNIKIFRLWEWDEDS